MTITTIVEALERRATRAGAPALWFEGSAGDGDEMGCADLLAESRQFARGLAARGIGRGARVVIVLPTGRELVASFYGTLVAGAVAVPLYPPLDVHQLRAFLTNLRRVSDLVQASAIVMFEPLEAAMPDDLPVVIPREIAAAGGGATLALPVPEPEDVALIQFSSGSTGDPRGVALTHHNIVFNIGAFGDAIDIRPPDVGVNWLPLYHDMGLIGTLIGSLVRDIPLVLLSPLDFLARPRLWLELLSKYQASIGVAPQFAYNLCLSRVGDDALDGLDLSSVRVLLNGAEPTDLELIRRFEERFARAGLRPGTVTPCYGLAEHALAVTMGVPGDPVDARYVRRATGEILREVVDQGLDLRVPSSGRPVAGSEVRIVSRERGPLGEDAIGEIAVRSDSVCRGYVTRGGASPAAEEDGWLSTGDLGFLSDGELYVVDRLKDIIKTAGRTVYPQDVEREATHVDWVRRGRIVAFGTRSAAAGTEALVIVAEVTTEREEQQLRCAAALRRAAVEVVGVAPHDVVLVRKGSIPLTSSGKVRRHRVKADYQDGRVAGTLLSLRGAAVRAAGADDPKVTA